FHQLKYIELTSYFRDSFHRNMLLLSIFSKLLTKLNTCLNDYHNLIYGQHFLSDVKTLLPFESLHSNKFLCLYFLVDLTRRLSLCKIKRTGNVAFHARL